MVRLTAAERPSEFASRSNSSLVWATSPSSHTSHRTFSSAFTVGRSRRCEVVIPTSDETRTISKTHARIFPVVSTGELVASRFNPQKWLLQDLDTLNGTAINGMDLMPGGSIELHDGDEVLLSSTMRSGVRLGIQIPDSARSRLIVKVFNATRSSPPRVTFESPPLWRGTTAFPPVLETPPRTRPTPVVIKRQRSSDHLATASRSENCKDASTPGHDVKRQRHDDSDDKERFMVCSVCLDYYYNSATLTCSHTFCGHCISHWFRTKSTLSCPECRTTVKILPVRNRALDDLVHKLVGTTDTYKAIERKRSSPSTSGSSCDTPAMDLHTHPLVFSRWSPQQKIEFGAFITKQFGDARISACRQVGLTESAIEGTCDRGLMTAAQNLMLDCEGIRATHEARDRFKIYLRYG